MKSEELNQMIAEVFMEEKHPTTILLMKEPSGVVMIIGKEVSKEVSEIYADQYQQYTTIKKKMEEDPKYEPKFTTITCILEMVDSGKSPSQLLTNVEEVLKHTKNGKLPYLGVD